VDEYVFQAFGVEAGQLGVEADRAWFCAAGAPAGLHCAVADFRNLHADDRLPAHQQRRDGRLQLPPVPGLDQGFAFGHRRPRADRQPQRRAAQFDRGLPLSFDHPQVNRPAPDGERLAAGVLMANGL